MINFNVTAIEAMYQQAVEMFIRSKHEPLISQDRYFGEALALHKVLRLLDPDFKILLEESLCLMILPERKSTATYNNDMTEGYVTLEVTV